MYNFILQFVMSGNYSLYFFSALITIDPAFSHGHG